jgi:hypothetical protein
MILPSTDRLEGNIKMYLKEIGCKAQDTIQWQVQVITVINVGDFFSRQATINFSRKTLHHVAS